jgi:putative salt-induced outer membrane protein YdiY
MLAATTGARADVIFTTDGSRIVGTVERIANGKVVIQTEIAGRLEIDASLLSGITTDAPVNVAVATGDVLVGPVETADGAAQATVHSALADVAVKPQDITGLWPKDAEHPAIVAAREQADARIAALTPKWTAKLEGGVTRTEGNTDTLQARGRFDVKRKTPSDLLNFYLEGNYYEQNDARSTNEYFGGIRYEASISERWYWYARTELEFDEFENIDLRATAAAGAGRYWLKQEDHELKTSLGAGYRHESYDNGESDDAFVLDLGLDYRYDLAPWLQFTHATVYSPDVEDFDDYRLKLDTALVFPLKDDRLAWKLGMRNEYNSRPQSGLDRLDNTYYTSIVWTLK